MLICIHIFILQIDGGGEKITHCTLETPKFLSSVTFKWTKTHSACEHFQFHCDLFAVLLTER